MFCKFYIINYIKFSSMDFMSINRKCFLVLVIILVSIKCLIAQPTDSKSEQFLITGKVLSTKDTSWKFIQTGFLENTFQQVVIGNDGSFNQSFFTEGMQDVKLKLSNEWITLYIQPNDTIELYWEDGNLNNTIRIVSPNAQRNIEFQLNLKQHKECSQPWADLYRKLGDSISDADTIAYRWINEQYNQQLKLVLEDSIYKLEHIDKFINQIYYQYSNLLLTLNLLPKYYLISDRLLVNPGNNPDINKIIPKSKSYKRLFDKQFYECPEYRDFLFDYVRFGSLFNSYYTGTYLHDEDMAPGTFGLNQYYCGLANLNIYPIRDWYLTKAIFDSFENYSFDESVTALNDFLPRCKSQIYKDTLISYFEKHQKFKPGSPAPPFTLKDENGKMVSLADFRGKIVYIDFWGVGCKPCRYQIANFVPKLFEKYKDEDVVFINICVDADEKTWKSTLQKTQLEGINLYAEGWAKNKACQDYNVKAVPHYFLIDREGKFVNSNMALPETIVNGSNVEIDKLLK